MRDEDFLRRYPAQVSVGQAQRVVIPMAVPQKPRLIIADEPTSAFDAASRTEILELLRSLNRQRDCAILFISHDLESMCSLCPTICSLLDGRRVGATGEMVGIEI
jgi:peptide/nickel transport system ATP-binding protein